MRCQPSFSRREHTGSDPVVQPQPTRDRCTGAPTVIGQGKTMTVVAVSAIRKPTSS